MDGGSLRKLARLPVPSFASGPRVISPSQANVFGFGGAELRQRAILRLPPRGGENPGSKLGGKHGSLLTGMAGIQPFDAGGEDNPVTAYVLPCVRDSLPA